MDVAPKRQLHDRYDIKLHDKIHQILDRQREQSRGPTPGNWAGVLQDGPDFALALRQTAPARQTSPGRGHSS
jgi:hypothetical protein